MGETNLIFKENYRNSSQDDYFLIGPTDRESGLSIAYPNRLKRHLFGSKIQLDNTQRRQLERKDVTKPSNMVIRGRKNESVQTICPRSTLQQEIKNIRNEIEKQKLRQQFFSKKTTANINGEFVKNRSMSDKYLNNSKPISQHLQVPFRDLSNQVKDESLKAPRTVKHHLKKVLKEYGSQEKTKSMGNKPRSVSPHKCYRLTEYQRAFRIPKLVHNPQPRNISIDPSIIPLKRINKSDIKVTNYTTEYNQQYKPFKYVTEGELASNIPMNTELKCHIVPIRRPRSAYCESRVAVLPATEVNHRQRSETPPNDNLKIRPHSTRFKTEYNAQYHNHGPHSLWSNTVTQTWQYANKYKQRHQSSHFISDHLAQLDSNCVDLWDTPSTDRYAEKFGKQEYFNSLPAAGKPTNVRLSQSDENKRNSSIKNKRRREMLSGQEVADILNPDDDAFSSESSVTGRYANPTYYDFACITRPQTADPVSVESIKRLNNYESNTARQSWGKETITLGTKHEYAPNFNSGSDEPSVSGSRNMRCVNTEGYSQHKPRTFVNERTAPMSPSPLSNRSIKYSNSTASETLERARRQRNRMFSHYRTDRYQPDRCDQTCRNSSIDRLNRTAY